MEIFIKPELLFCAHFEIFVYIYSVHQAEEVIKQVFLPWFSLIRCLKLHLVGTEATGCQLRTKLHGQRDWLTGKNACHTIRRNWDWREKNNSPNLFSDLHFYTLVFVWHTVSYMPLSHSPIPPLFLSICVYVYVYTQTHTQFVVRKDRIIFNC